MTPERLRSLTNFAAEPGSIEQILRDAAIEAADLWAQSLLIGSRVEQEKVERILRDVIWCWDAEDMYALNAAFARARKHLKLQLTPEAAARRMEDPYDLLEKAQAKVADLRSQLLSTEQERDTLKRGNQTCVAALDKACADLFDKECALKDAAAQRLERLRSGAIR